MAQRKRASPKNRPAAKCPCAAVANDWKRYARYPKSIAIRNRLVEAYLPFAQQLVLNLSRRFPAQMNRDQFFSDVQLALIWAVEHFEPARGFTFETFARPRLVGAILDAARNADPVSRLSRRRIKSHDAAADRLRQDFGRSVSTEEIEGLAGKCKPPPTTSSLYHEIFFGHDEIGVQGFSMAGALPAPARRHPNDRFFIDATRSLNFREKVVLYLHFFRGHTMKAVADIMGCSEARISQMISESLAEIRALARKPRVRQQMLEEYGLRDGSEMAEE